MCNDPTSFRQTFPALSHGVSPLLVNLAAEEDNLFVDNEADDAQNGGTVMFELNDTLGELDLLVELFLARVDVAVAEDVCEHVASSLDIAPEVEIQG